MSIFRADNDGFDRGAEAADRLMSENRVLKEEMAKLLAKVAAAETLAMAVERLCRHDVSKPGSIEDYFKDVIGMSSALDAYRAIASKEST